MLTLLKVLQSNAFTVHRVPVQLAASVVGMTVERRDYTFQPKGDPLGPKAAATQCFNKCAHDVIPKAYVGAIGFDKVIDHGKWVLHPVNQISDTFYYERIEYSLTVRHFVSYHT